MIAQPGTALPPQLGPLRAPTEQQLVAAYPALRREALTLPWAAVALGVPPVQLERLAAAGELLVVPGPWSMRQAHASGLGYFLPAWQLAPGGRLREVVPAIVAAAVRRNLTSLELHRLMTTPHAGTAPATLLREGDERRVLDLLDGQPAPCLARVPQRGWRLPVRRLGSPLRPRAAA